MVPMVQSVPIEKHIIPMVLLLNMHLIKGTDYFPCDLAGYRAIPMVHWYQCCDWYQIERSVSHVRLHNMSPIYIEVSLCFYAFPCFPYVIPCLPCFSTFFPGFPCFSMFFLDSPRIPLFFYVFPCFSVFFYVFR